MTKKSMRSPDRCPTHPGTLLREVVLPAVPLSKSAIAQALGISRQTLYDVLGERQPVTPNIAVRLGTYFGNGATLWLNMQTAYDLWHAKRDVDVSKIKRLEAAE
jgi:antitoxin HigA-1